MPNRYINLVGLPKQVVYVNPVTRQPYRVTRDPQSGVEQPLEPVTFWTFMRASVMALPQWGAGSHIRSAAAIHAALDSAEEMPDHYMVVLPEEDWMRLVDVLDRSQGLPNVPMALAYQLVRFIEAIREARTTPPERLV